VLGSPGPVNDFARRSAFMSSYDRRMRNPAWVGILPICMSSCTRIKKANISKVAEHITPESLGTNKGDRKNSVFLEDEAGRLY